MVRGGPSRRYYLPYEVAQHNTAMDCWVSFLGQVLDITPLLRDYPGTISEPLIKEAGKDISHWFDAKTRDVKLSICPVTNLQRYHTPMGRFPHIPPIEPVGNWDTSYGIPWWKDKKYLIGSLSSKVRVVRIKNVLTNQEGMVEVPREETMAEIRERYLEINSHARSYTFKSLILSAEDGSLQFQELDLNKTLQENKVPDESAIFEDLEIPADFYIPVIHAYWNDDLTEA